jgi:tetratricopeptide (TPR) repeat protein
MARVRSTLVALVLLLSGTRAVGAAELELPTAAMQRYYDAERRTGAERSEALARALMALAVHSPPAVRQELLQKAARADPTLPEPHLAYARLQLQRHDLAGACVALRDAAQCVVDDAVQQAAWLRRLERLGHTLPLVTLATLVLLFTARSTGFVHHLVEVRPRIVAAALVAAAAVVLIAYTVAPILGVLVLLALLAPFLARSERRTLAGLLVTLAVFELALPRFQGHAMLLDPSSASALLARTHLAGWDPALQTEIVERVAPGRERELVLGLLARRRGDGVAARNYYLASLLADSTWGSAYVNLANVFFLSGAVERASTGYRTALEWAPNSAIAHANLAQACIRLLNFDESDVELARAADLGFDAYKWRHQAWLRDNVPVVDIGLRAGELVGYAVHEARANPDRALQVLASWRGPAWGHLSPFKLPWVLLVLAALLFSPLSARALAFECMSCARVVCTHCTRSREAEARLCPYCSILTVPAERGTGPTPSRRERPRGRLHLQPPRVANRGPAWTVALFPGAADLAAGAPQVSVWTALLAWAALLVASTAVHTAAQRTTPWFAAVDTQALRTAAVVFWLAYVPGLLRLWRNRGLPAPNVALSQGS